MGHYLLIISIISIYLILSPVDGHRSYSRRYSDADERNWREFEEFREWKKLKSISELKNRNNFGEHGVIPPPIDKPALMARFIVNQADWSSVATISTSEDIVGYPFVNVISVSDGPAGNGSGIVYMFLTPLDFTAKDLEKDPRVTAMMTLAQGSYCQDNVMDPMDPRCARVAMTGVMKTVSAGDDDYDVAKSAMFGRHPWLAHMPPNHHFFLAKLEIGTIAVLDTFGGPKYVTVEDYLNPPEVKKQRDVQTLDEDLKVYRI